MNDTIADALYNVWYWISIISVGIVLAAFFLFVILTTVVFLIESFQYASDVQDLPRSMFSSIKGLVKGFKNDLIIPIYLSIKKSCVYEKQPLDLCQDFIVGDKVRLKDTPRNREDRSKWLFRTFEIVAIDRSDSNPLYSIFDDKMQYSVRFGGSYLELDPEYEVERYVQQCNKSVEYMLKLFTDHADKIEMTEDGRVKIK